MKVAIEQEGEGCTVVAVYLDNGEEIGRYMADNDPKAELLGMRRMLNAVAAEAVRKERARLDRAVAALKATK